MASNKITIVNKFTVIKDTREQNGWNFSKEGNCDGTVVEKLDTGDYSLKGLEDKFTIERKGCVAEFATNLFQERFYRELDRLNKFEHPYLILEFPFDLMEIYPKNSSIPMCKWEFVKIRGNMLIKSYHEMRLSYPNIRVDFVGSGGKFYSFSLFKRITELYGRKV